MTTPNASAGYYHMGPLAPAESPSFGALLGVVNANNDATNFNVTDSYSSDVSIYMKVTTASP